MLFAPWTVVFSLISCIACITTAFYWITTHSLQRDQTIKSQYAKTTSTGDIDVHSQSYSDISSTWDMSMSCSEQIPLGMDAQAINDVQSEPKLEIPEDQPRHELSQEEQHELQEVEEVIRRQSLEMQVKNPALLAAIVSNQLDAEPQGNQSQVECEDEVEHVSGSSTRTSSPDKKQTANVQGTGSRMTNVQKIRKRWMRRVNKKLNAKMNNALTKASSWDITIRVQSLDDFKCQLKPLAFSAVLMAVGIGLMHYSAMLGVIVNADQEWNFLITFGIVIYAIIASFIALSCMVFLDGLPVHVACSFVIAIAACLIHYGAMFGVTYVENKSTFAEPGSRYYNEMKQEFWTQWKDDVWLVVLISNCSRLFLAEYIRNKVTLQRKSILHLVHKMGSKSGKLQPQRRGSITID